ncbi:hypothetical protein P3T76_001775 [Phytophthora citrophthora]|uniref:Tudor domain-containing protein n=1 Tax=Phytophthora citrophthora TaxID=4793 RepID=A0AAD9LTA2_9STRA|nr:hypothetical protein P3T76_001775 [Phytophthora citrophthora]
MATIAMRGVEAVRCRVQVYWEGEDEWFEGVVDSYSDEKGYYIKYEDGEEQWELDVGEHPIKFLPELGSGRSGNNSVGDGENHEENDESDTENYEEEQEEEYEDDSEHEEQDEQVDLAEEEEVSGPIPEKRETLIADRAIQPQKVVKPARAFMRTSAAFFRDEETLREMQMDLRQDKKTLLTQVHVLSMQLVEKEQVSAALKSELQHLKTSSALVNAMRQIPKAVTLSSSPSGSIREQSRPKTAVEWGERVLDQKLENQSLAEELLALKAAVQDKQLSVQRKQKCRDEMGTKLARIPRRHLCTLVDLQVEISRLLEEKRSLECKSDSPSVRKQPGQLGGMEVNTSTKAALQNELTSLEITTEKYKEELRQWELKLDCEKARLAPLEAHLVSLQQDLRRYEDSQVLLRSVFIRLGPDSRDGCVPLEAALTAFQTLTPLDQESLNMEEMLIRLKEGGLLDSEQQRFSFAQFVEAFNCLFKLGEGAK